jgi:hypothetical protein
MCNHPCWSTLPTHLECCNINRRVSKSCGVIEYVRYGPLLHDDTIFIIVWARNYSDSDYCFLWPVHCHGGSLFCLFVIHRPFQFTSVRVHRVRVDSRLVSKRGRKLISRSRWWDVIVVAGNRTVLVWPTLREPKMITRNSRKRRLRIVGAFVEFCWEWSSHSAIDIKEQLAPLKSNLQEYACSAWRCRPFLLE